MKDSELCYRAAELIAERGHAKGRMVDDDGRLCVYGALLTAELGGIFETSYPANNSVLELVMKAITKLGLRGSAFWAVGWNDAPGTTAEDVILALKHAGSLAQDQEEAGYA